MASSYHTGSPQCSTNNKNVEADTGVQPEDQKSRTAKPLKLLPLRNLLTLKETKFLPDPGFCFSSAGIKGLHHYHRVSMVH